MRPFDFKRQVLPHLLAVTFFLVLMATYVSPILFENKQLVQNDILQSKGGSKEIIDYRERTGKEALWTNAMFSGMPAYLINTNFPGDLSKYVHVAMTLNLPAVAANIFLTLVCAYVLFVVMGMSTWLSIVGAIAFTFTSYNFVILEAGHNTKSLAIAYIPLALAGLLYAFRKGTRQLIIGTALFTFGFTMHVRANHPQITYYLMLLILVFGIVQLVYAVREKWVGDYSKRVILLGFGLLIAVGVSFGRLYTAWEYGKYSIRGKSELKPIENNGNTSSGLDRDYAFQWSYGVSETMTLLIPNFRGGASQGALDADSETATAFARLGMPADQMQQMLNALPLYWGDQPSTSGPVYVGAIICFLFVLGLLVVESRLRIWLLAATIFSILLSWGKNFEAFNYFMFDYFPAYNKFRAVSMALVIAQVAMPLLGIFALSSLLKTSIDKKVAQKKILLAAGITGGLCVLVFLFAGMADYVGAVDEQLTQMQWPVDALRADRESMMRSDAFRSLVFILLAAGVLYFYLKNKLTPATTTLVIGLLILIDLWSVDKRYLSKEDFQPRLLETHFEPSPADQAILQDKDLSYRVINMANPFNDARTSYFHKSIGGYHGAKLRRYQDVIDQHISQNNVEVLNMLNTRYIITGNPQQPVQRNPQALGNAWFVKELIPVNSPDEELAGIKGLYPANEAVVDVSKFPVKEKQFNQAGSMIRLTEYEPNYLKYVATAVQDGFVVFSEIYYKDGWQAYLDGTPVDHIRVNYILRGMPVPAGNHTIEFKFAPKEYDLGNTVSLISSVLMLLVVVGGVYYAFKGTPGKER
ncbi:YfhO family protein [Adhaeribacter aquaticus]|uniref:YfhO family protein n=1 Tax=Adhaeribacter aquaticus TaxID=299567 RepID=UPI0003FDB0D0|nr:YfhO family protein [Adhaeribacter aquaticus]